MHLTDVRAVHCKGTYRQKNQIVALTYCGLMFLACRIGRTNEGGYLYMFFFIMQ